VSNLSPLPPLNGYSRDWPEFSIVENYIGELVSVACVLGQEKVFAASLQKRLMDQLTQHCNQMDGHPLI